VCSWLGTGVDLTAVTGNIIGLTVLGNHIVVLNSLEAISELLEKRGINYAHRPVFTVVGELMGLDQVRFQPCCERYER